jgi:glycosyltransferase involved in cell wall biosynthesis
MDSGAEPATVRVDPPTLSAIVLGYRAGADIEPLTTRLIDVLDAEGVSYEVVLVGNFWPGSEDVTPMVVERLAAERDSVRAVVAPKQGGMGWDMRSGLAAAVGEYLVVIDGDEQNPVEDVARMFRLMRDEGWDVMKGRRTQRGDGLARAVISAVYNVAFRVLFRTTGLWDINGKPKGLRRSAYRRMRLRADDWFVDAEIVLEARRHGLRLGEMPVRFLDSKRPSFVRLSAILEFVVNMLRRRLRGDPR